MKTRGAAKSIKDLKDLRALRGRECYRHAGPKGPEEKERRFSPSRGRWPGTPARLRVWMRGPSPYGEVPLFFVARGTGPRERWSARARTMARDTRSRYGKNVSASLQVCRT